LPAGGKQPFSEGEWILDFRFWIGDFGLGIGEMPLPFVFGAVAPNPKSKIENPKWECLGGFG
jgi:hypothetical protein